MVNFLNYDHLLFEVHSVKSGVSFHVVRLGLPQLGLNVEFLWCVPRFFLVFLFFFLTSVGQAGGREAAPATHTCTATLVCKAGTLGTQFASPLFFFSFPFFFFLLAAAICPRLCVLVPEPLLDRLHEPVRPVCGPCPAPGGTAPAARPQHAPAMLENSLPFEPHPPLPPWLSNVLSPHVD